MGAKQSKAMEMIEAEVPTGWVGPESSLKAVERVIERLLARVEELERDGYAGCDDCTRHTEFYQKTTYRARLDAMVAAIYPHSDGRFEEIVDKAVMALGFVDAAVAEKFGEVEP